VPDPGVFGLVGIGFDGAVWLGRRLRGRGDRERPAFAGAGALCRDRAACWAAAPGVPARLNPPMAGQWQLTPLHCLKIVALARLICPTAEIRLAGGRELHLGTLQGLALHLANSIFLGDYLTAEGQAAAADHALIRDNGFVTDTAVRPETSPEQSRSLRIRQRGAGTNVDPNA